MTRSYFRPLKLETAVSRSVYEALEMEALLAQRTIDEEVGARLAQSICDDDSMTAMRSLRVDLPGRLVTWLRTSASADGRTLEERLRFVLLQAMLQESEKGEAPAEGDQQGLRVEPISQGKNS